MADLPYITATGNIERALRAIQSAATPTTVSQDFVKTILKIPGGSGNQVTSFLKKIGFAEKDGSTSELYRRFRNETTAGAAAAEALRIGYAPLFKRNEYLYKLADKDLRGLIVEETGRGNDSTVVSLILASVNAIKRFSTWDVATSSDSNKALVPMPQPTNGHADGTARQPGPNRVGLNLAYTINLNLPATSDVAVFNAIFKSLKENLLQEDNDQSR